MRKGLAIIAILSVCCLMGCADKDSKKETKNSLKDEIIEWKYDLTGDGVEEKILVNIDSTNPNAEKYIDVEVPNTVEVYSGKTNEMIWSIRISDVHMEQNSINLYEKDGKYYLLKWTPQMYQGSARYAYEIFSLSDDGEELVLESNEVKFDVSKSGIEDIYKIYDFIFDCRDKISKSFVLVDTMDELSYSTEEEKVTVADPYDDIKGVIANITEQMYNRYKGN